MTQPYTYTSREYDPETNLYYYRARYYDPSIGRFLQVDPIGYIGGINLYTYVGNNPVNWRDPYGLCEEEFWDPIKKFWDETLPPLPPYPPSPGPKPPDLTPTPLSEAMGDKVKDVTDFFGNQPPGTGGPYQPFLDAATILDKLFDWAESQN